MGDFFYANVNLNDHYFLNNQMNWYNSLLDNIENNACW